VSGDFDRDRNPDLIIAARGGNELVLVSGDGKGGFANPRFVAVHGAITALAAGEVDVPDDRADLVVAVAGVAGAALNVYEDAERGVLGAPEVHPWDAPATSIAIGSVDATPFGGIAAVAGGAVAILHGHDTRAASGSEDPSARIERVPFPFGVRAIALGPFEWNRAGRHQMALLTDDGAIRSASPGALDTRPYTAGEVRNLRRRNATARAILEPVRAWTPGASIEWLAGEPDVVPQSARDSLLFAGEAPTLALPLRLGVDVRPGLVLLRDGDTAPTFVMAAPAAAIVVNDTTDTVHSPGCATTGTGTCSLRDAILFSNVNAGTDTISFAAATNGTPFTLTIANTAGANEDASQRGDLDINDSVTIVGNGSANTILQAGTTNANGIDKVIAVNPLCTTAVNVSISGVTIRFGTKHPALRGRGFQLHRGRARLVRYGDRRADDREFRHLGQHECDWVRRRDQPRLRRARDGHRQHLRNDDHQQQDSRCGSRRERRRHEPVRRQAQRDADDLSGHLQHGDRGGRGRLVHPPHERRHDRDPRLDDLVECRRQPWWRRVDSRRGAVHQHAGGHDRPVERDQRQHLAGATQG
jgi:hypothetical protein